MNKPTMRQKGAGFTLIELMGALVIFSILMIAMFQSFVSTQRSYSLLEGYAQLQENARFSEDALARTLRMAGYRSNPGVTMSATFSSSATAAAPTTNTFSASGQVVSGENNNANGADVILNGSDSISIRFQGNALISDCFGNIVGDSYTSVNTFYVRTDNSLHCSYRTYNPGGGLVSSDDQPLAEGVEEMQILYGVDTSADLVAGTYLPASSVTALQWPNVVSVRLAVLYNTVNRIPDISTQSFPMLDNYTSTYTDGLRRQLFTTTINLRNRSL